MFKLHALILIIFVISQVFLLSCGADQIVINPNYNNHYYESASLKKSNLNVMYVLDNRIDTTVKQSDKKSRPSYSSNSSRSTSKNIPVTRLIQKDSYNYLGVALTGTFDSQTPYRLSDSVTTFVRKSVSSMFSTNPKADFFVPVNIRIDTLLVSEKTGLTNGTGTCIAALDFSYPLKNDSIIHVSTYSEQVTFGVDVTDALEDLVYKSIAECTVQFLNVYNKSGGAKPEPDKPISTKNTTSSKPSEVTIKGYKTKEKPKTNTGFDIYYHSGNNVKSGFTASYLTFIKSGNTQFYNGLGFKATYFDIQNNSKISGGTFFAFSGVYSPLYFFSEALDGLFLSGALSITGGSEKVGSKTNYFFGPTIEEFVGVKLGTVMLKAGAYQIVLLGSDILPNDVGFSIGIGLWLK